MSQVTIHHPSSYGYSGQVGLPAAITAGASATFSWQNLDPTTGYTVIWGDATGNGSFTSSATGTGSAAHTYASNGTYTQRVTNTATGQTVATRTFTVPYAGGGFAPRALEEGKASKASAEEPAEEPTNGDDPADYTVAEVQQWAEDYPDQLEDIIAAEEAGKARVTLLNHLYSLRP